MTEPTRVPPSAPALPGGRLAGALLTLLLVAAVAVWGIDILPRSEAAPPRSGSRTSAKPKTGAVMQDNAANAQPGGDAGKNPFPGKFPAPSLDGGTGWLNTSGEITLADLRGKVVLLDFWTYCCINCMHILPDLEYLEEKYPNGLVVIGVHSAKFDNEKESDNIREAILRYEISHPVINDSNMMLWRKFQVSSWPTLAIIDPEGKYVGFLSGEGNRKNLDMVIGKLIEYHRAKKTLDETPVRFDLERHRAERTPLRFPGKVLADAKSGRLFIADSNHNRIVVADMDGKLLDVIGSGTIGRKDGSYTEAMFDHPQGMALNGETLYVADTENHLLRQIDLKGKTVATLAGTGQQAPLRPTGGSLRQTPLNSPWDLQIVGDTLYIAMAGPHQIWSHELGSDRIRVFAGNGREDVANGSLKQSSFAQPSGLTTDGKNLYVCDSEGSAIRRVPLTGGAVTTIAGTSDLSRGRSLFEFGDKDGRGSDARLQHPLGIAWRDGTLYVADTYNQKIKTIDAGTHEVTTYLGDGTAGESLAGPVQFNEPAGLSIAGDRLFVADTNNHRICVVNLKNKTVSEVKIDGLEPPPKPDEETAAVQPKEFTPVLPQIVAAGKELSFEIDLKLPEGYKLNALAPVTYRLGAQDRDLIAAKYLDSRQKAEADGTAIRFDVPLTKPAGRTTLELALSYGYCREGTGGLCKVSTARWRVPVEVTVGAQQKTIRLQAAPESPTAR